MVHSGVVLHVLQIDVDLHAVHDQSTVHSSTPWVWGSGKVRPSVGQCIYLQQIVQAGAYFFEHYLKVLNGFSLFAELGPCLTSSTSHDNSSLTVRSETLPSTIFIVVKSMPTAPLAKMVSPYLIACERRGDLRPSAALMTSLTGMAVEAKC